MTHFGAFLCENSVWHGSKKIGQTSYPNGAGGCLTANPQAAMPQFKNPSFVCDASNCTPFCLVFRKPTAKKVMGEGGREEGGGGGDGEGKGVATGMGRAIVKTTHAIESLNTTVSYN